MSGVLESLFLKLFPAAKRIPEAQRAVKVAMRERKVAYDKALDVLAEWTAGEAEAPRKVANGKH